MGTRSHTPVPGQTSEEATLQETRTFVVVRQGGESRVMDLPPGEPVAVGSNSGAQIQVEGPEIAPTHLTLESDGQRIALTQKASGGTYLNGKRFEGIAELKPGDEIALGAAQLVVGLAGPLTLGGRRAFTHHEFRERLYEEMARAARGNRPTALAMVQARPGEGGRVAAVALDSFRAGDVVGTYSHDELEFLFPDASHDTAQAVVDRVLSSADVHAAVGLAVAPTDADSAERLLKAARSALARARNDRPGLATPPPRLESRIEPIVHDPATRQLVEQLEALASSNTPVLLTGELSSGKGVFARLLHERSARASGPFVVIRCASLSTDEDIDRAFGPAGQPGDAEARMARGGTLLLDEIGDLRPEGQGRLIALLNAERNEAETFRLVTTTHRALGGLVERGAFEAELYQRIQGEGLEVPALRNRPEDIIPLAEAFAEEFGARKPVAMTAGALARLRSYPWPGNVLELRNAMERAVRLAHGGEILGEHLPSETIPFAPNEGRLREHVDGVERDAIIKALAECNHNQTHAARRLGVSRRALIYKMEKYGLKAPPGSARK